MEEKVVLGGTGRQGALQVAGRRVKGEQGGLAGVRRRRGLALPQQVVAGAAELCRGGARGVVHGGEAPQGVCAERKHTCQCEMGLPHSPCSQGVPYVNALAFMEVSVVC